MNNRQKATCIEEVAAQVTVEPLRSGDARWVDLTSARSDADLRHLRILLQDYANPDSGFAKIAFTGHRGCGKSTELFRLAHDLEEDFVTLHLFADETLIQDCDYTELMLWLVHSLVNEFKDRGYALDERLVGATVDWFAERAIEDIKIVNTEIQAEAQAEGAAGGSLYVIKGKLLARLKSMIRGSVERRMSMRRRLQQYASELIDQVNLLLDEAARVLNDNGKQPRLLVIQDNLDRLPPDTARRLFITNGDLLKSLDVHAIYTVPIAITLAPDSISSVFENCFAMPMVKVTHRDGSPHEEGLQGLVEGIAERVDIDSVFTSRDVARRMAEMSGGSVRDLMRLVNYTQLAARADGKAKMDDEAAEQALRKMRIEFERLLIPGEVYYPLLAHVHEKKHSWILNPERADPQSVQAAREFFSQLLFNGTVLEYNGEEAWYDVHPVVRDIREFKDACQTAD